VERVVKECAKLAVSYLTVFAFSTENWQRPAREINTLWRYLLEFLEKKRSMLLDNNVVLRMMGFRSNIPGDVLAKIDDVVRQSATNTGMRLTVALNYSGRAEIVHACQEIARRVSRDELTADDVTEQTVCSMLLTKDVPDPDLLIRTSGEIRISNFMLFQLAYTELYFTNTLWPDFNEKELHKAIDSYRGRSRRFGGIHE